MRPGDLSCRYFFTMHPNVFHVAPKCDIWDREHNEIIGTCTIGSAELMCNALNEQDRREKRARSVGNVGQT
jgi:hypothetical protein